jgi:hypothetical protein
MLTIIIISIYLVSLVSSCYLNKWLYKIDSDFPIMTVFWIFPIFNSLFVFALIILLISNFGIFKEEYWKNKWD